jgi:choloylglycine hydrolase
VADQKNLVYVFDSATSPNAFWVEFKDLDFKEGAPVMKLTMRGGKVYAGNVADKLEPAQPFKWLEAQPSS